MENNEQDLKTKLKFNSKKSFTNEIFSGHITCVLNPE